MQKRAFAHITWKSLLAIGLATTIANAEDYVVIESSSVVNWRTSYQRASEESQKDGKPMLLKVSASWCGPCKQMKQLTFSDSRIVELMRSEFVAVSIDADEQPDLVSGFNIEAYPTTIVIAPDRTILKRLKGFQSADSLLSALGSIPRTQTTSKVTTPSEPVASALEPANGVKFGFDGVCLVSLLEETRVRKGSPNFVAEHRGQTVCFQTEEHLQRFLAEPDRFWPVADGQCLVSSREGLYAYQGDPKMAVTWRGRIWMFTDRERQRRFIQTPSYYANQL